MQYNDFFDLFKKINNNAKRLYSGGSKELKTVSRKLASQYLEHDKSRKSRTPFPNIPNIAAVSHPQYEVDVTWDIHQISVGGVSSLQYLLKLYDKVKAVSIYILVTNIANTKEKQDSSIYKFSKDKDKEQFIFYPEPDIQYMFAITDADKEKLGFATFNDFLAWVIPMALSGKLALLL
jgi:hypothetical protein